MTKDKIKSWEEISFLAEELKALGGRIVFTNGCFDILHAGHVQYLEQAKALGDILIVGLNSDESIRRLKGSSRPIVPQEERAYVLAGLQCVDYVVVFDQDTPLELIRLIHPDTLVKGGDWKQEEIIGSDIVLKQGGKVLSLPFRDGLSTTSIINKITENTTRRDN